MSPFFNDIALAGGTWPVFLVSDSDELTVALESILAQVLGE